MGFLAELQARSETSEFRQRLSVAERVQSRDDLLQLGNGIAAQDSAITSIACFTLWPESYDQVIANAILIGGDTDTIAAMAGAISGAHLGVDAIPKHFLDRLEDDHKGRTYIMKLAQRLAAL